MKYIKPLNERVESEDYQEAGLEGVSAKEVLMNVYTPTMESIIKDFDKQCDESVEFKNKNLDMTRSLIKFCSKYHTPGKFMNTMMIKYNLK